MSDQDSSIAEYVTGLVEDVSPKQLVGVGKRIFSETSQAKLNKAIQGFEDDDYLRALVADAIRAETAEFARAESLDQVLDVAVKVLLEVQRQGGPEPARSGPAEEADEMWEHALLHQRLSSAIDDSFEQRRDLDLGITQGRRQSPPDGEVLRLMRRWVDRLQPWLGAVERLLEEHLPKALGTDGEPGDIRELDYVARTVGRMHAEFIALGHEWLALGASGKWRRVVDHQVRVALSLADDIERFRDDLGRAVQAGRQHDGREPLEICVTLELRGHGIADVSDLVAETLGRSV